MVASRRLRASLVAAILAVATGSIARAQDWLVDPSPYAARVVVDEATGRVALDNGLVRRLLDTRGGGATISLWLVGEGRELLRTVKPEARLVVDGEVVQVGGFEPAPVQNYIDPAWLSKARPAAGALRAVEWTSGPLRERFAWKPRPEWLSRPAQWPPKGVRVQVRHEGEGRWQGLSVVVEHELHDGLPLVAKRVVVANRTGRQLRLSECVAEVLGFVEAQSDVELPRAWKLPPVHVETDAPAILRPVEPVRRPAVRWLEDPSYATQVNYALRTPCLLETAPPLGPDALLADGATFESHRTWILCFDDDDAARRSLALSRFYRAVAPWTQENPLIFHAASSEPDKLVAAIDQAADVGFELVVMTFGSGANLESRDPAYLARMKAAADHAHARGVAVGGYSLLASRSISPEVDVVDPDTGRPGGAVFGNSPCLASAWGDDYFASLRGFFEATGMDVLEHDGSYPGDACASTSHSGHRGLGDSYWGQRGRVADFYRWARGRGIYLNVPDWHFLNGSSKCAMGYRETNWSLPREHQEVIERQNIADGLATKGPTMGWMFVPLMEYHGGGPAATIEPLSEHLDHYRLRLRNLLGAGVQACWRGPRLYDTPETRAMVEGEVRWFKSRRRILESDVVLLRRADGADWDGWLHVDPGGPIPALAMLYNPLPVELRRAVRLPLRFSGLRDAALVEVEGAGARVLPADEEGRVALEVVLPPRGSKWVELRAAP
ncbi:MAG: hypothetical protein RL112_2257 [Planctomycetota bacterium]